MVFVYATGSGMYFLILSKICTFTNCQELLHETSQQILFSFHAFICHHLFIFFVLTSSVVKTVQQQKIDIFSTQTFALNRKKSVTG